MFCRLQKLMLACPAAAAHFANNGDFHYKHGKFWFLPEAEVTQKGECPILKAMHTSGWKAAPLSEIPDDESKTNSAHGGMNIHKCFSSRIAVGRYIFKDIILTMQVLVLAVVHEVYKQMKLLH